MSANAGCQYRVECFFFFKVKTVFRLIKPDFFGWNGIFTLETFVSGKPSSLFFRKLRNLNLRTCIWPQKTVDKGQIGNGKIK